MSLLKPKKNSYLKNLSLKIMKTCFPEKKRWGFKETPGYICSRGSLTVEAAVVLSILACLFAFLLYYFQIMQVQLYVQDALEQTGHKMAVYACAIETEEEPDTAYKVLAKTLFVAQLAEKKKINRFVTGGMTGISLLDSEYTANTISLKAVYTAGKTILCDLTADKAPEMDRLEWNKRG